MKFRQKENFKILSNAPLRGEIAKRSKEARKGLLPNSGKNTSNIPTKRTTKRNKLNIHYPPLHIFHETKTSHRHTITKPILIHTCKSPSPTHPPNKQTKMSKTSQTVNIPKNFLLYGCYLSQGVRFVSLLLATLPL